jgi:branched-chain amino acid transport system substrate-binding protein
LAGFAMQTALNIAVTDLNKQGGILGVPIRLITYDSAGIPERGAQFAERLILLDCAVGIVGLYHNDVALAVIDVAHRYGVPVIIAGANSDEITARGYPEVFRLSPTDSMLAQMPAQWLTDIGDYNSDGQISAAIIADNTNRASSIIEATQNHLIEASISTELLRIDLPSTDFSSVIARLVAHEQLPDAIFIYVKGQPALLLQTELLAAGIGPQSSSLLVQNKVGLNSAQFWLDIPGGTNTIVARHGPWHSTLTTRGQEFVIKYDQYMGRWPEAYAFASYDALVLMANAMRKAPSLAGSDLINALERCDDEITSGRITFTSTSHTAESATQPPHLWHQWQETQILYLQYTYPNQPADAMPVIWPVHYRPLKEETAASPTEP